METRRNFIKKSALGVAGLAVGSSGWPWQHDEHVREKLRENNRCQ